MSRFRSIFLALLLAHVVMSGCARRPSYISLENRKSIDRQNIEYPRGFEFRTAISGLTGPSAIAFVNDEGPYQGALLVAESGLGGYRPRIYGFKRDGAFFEIYPARSAIPLDRVAPLGLLRSGREIYGPIGGMVVAQGRIYVTHRDRNGRGLISSFDFDGRHTTIVAELPAQGDFALTDIAVHPTTGRLYFGVGAATNSGVVGLDNWQVGWIKRNPKFCDIPAADLKLLGFRFDTKNPQAGIFGGNDLAVTAPFSPFGVSNQTRIARSASQKPTSAIFSVSPAGGDLRLEAHGVRLPRGMGFNEYATLFFTNNGMELRGTRPVKDDPDVLLKFLPNTWYGFPDFSADLFSISESRFQPPKEMMKFGYPELTTVLDLAGSGLYSPAAVRETLVFGVFPALSGAAKFDFAPAIPAFREYRGNAIIAMSGDRAPFATSGRALKVPLGYKIVRVDLDARGQVQDFIRNARPGPGSSIKAKGELLERPIDVKFGPDGKMYILDFGRMEMKNGREKLSAGTGKIFVLEPIDQPPTTAPSR